MIKDCFGVPAIVGDHIAFSKGNVGAQPFEDAVITKITAKSVCFGERYSELRRGEGCFVIDVLKRGSYNCE